MWYSVMVSMYSWCVGLYHRYGSYGYNAQLTSKCSMVIYVSPPFFVSTCEWKVALLLVRKKTTEKNNPKMAIKTAVV